MSEVHLRTILIILGVALIPSAVLAAEQKPAKAAPKLAAMLAAKDKTGKPIITQEERTYYNGLNDNLKELLNQAVQKEVITKAGALKDASGAAVASAKDGVGPAEQLHPLPQRS